MSFRVFIYFHPASSRETRASDLLIDQSENNNEVKFSNCTLGRYSTGTITTFFVQRSYRKISLDSCKLEFHRVDLETGNGSLEHTNVLSFAHLQLENCAFYNSSTLHIFAESHMSFAAVEIYGTTFIRSRIYQYQTGGYVSLHVNECKFLDIYKHCIYFAQTNFINISNYHFERSKEKHCTSSGCILDVEGRSFRTVNLKLACKLLYPPCSSGEDLLKFEFGDIGLYNSTFIASLDTNSYIINTETYALTITSCYFGVSTSITPYSFETKGMIFYSGTYFKITETTFAAKRITVASNIRMIIFTAKVLNLTNINIFCPRGLKGLEVSDKEKHVTIYSCHKACQQEQIYISSWNYES